MENHIKMDDLGGKPTIFGNIRFVSFLLLLVFPSSAPLFGIIESA